MTTARMHLVEASESEYRVLPIAVCGHPVPNAAQHAADEHEVTCLLCARVVAKRTAEAALAVPPSPWLFTGDRARELRSAVEGVLSRIDGSYMRDDRPPLAREERWASIGHALGTLVAWRLDGPSHGATNGASVLEVGRYGGRVQWTRKARPPSPISLAEDLVPVERALGYAFAEMPAEPEMHRALCEFVVVLRYAGRLGPKAIAEELETRGIAAVRTRAVGRVTRHGAQRVYEYLRVRDLVPEWRERGQEVTAMAGRVSVSGCDLHGWGEIAGFLGIGESTARLWERDRGLPVHRGPSGGIEAVSGELVEWRKHAAERYRVANG